MRGRRALAKAILTAPLVILVGCPDTTSIVGGSTDEVGDEVGEAPAPGDVVEDHRTYFIGESTKFDGGGDCDNADLNTVTSTLRKTLAEAGWSGQRLVDEGTWPEDFREETLVAAALDSARADAARLTIYAGHGNVGRLQWGRPSDNGQCATTLMDQVRLGTSAGDTAASTMFMTSCTLRVDTAWDTLETNACRQFFGYHNSPHIGYDEARKVFKRIQDGQSTVSAWLEEMVHNVSGSNSPVAFTMGITSVEALNVHGTTNLATGEGYLTNVGEPPKGYFYEWFNNGCTFTCGGCGDDALVVPEITLGTLAPQLTLTRPSRSSAGLVERVLPLLTIFDIGALSADEQARLEAWASEVVASRDVTHAWIVDEPRIDLTYDPQSDELRITNRSALEQARPAPRELVEDPPDLEAALRVEAHAIRDQLQNVPNALDYLATEFQVSTREIGFGSGNEPPSASIAYEYLFELPGRFDGLELADRSLEIGVTRLGEASTIVVASVDLQTAGEVRILRTPQQALDQLSAAIHAEYPNVVDIEFVDPRVGYTLVEEQTTSQTVPSLLVSYVLTFGADDARVVSRSFPVRISLVTPDAPIESLEALDPNPQPGDSRDSH